MLSSRSSKVKAKVKAMTGRIWGLMMNKAMTATLSSWSRIGLGVQAQEESIG
jgi:hypothetical protein